MVRRQRERIAVRCRAVVRCYHPTESEHGHAHFRWGGNSEPLHGSARQFFLFAVAPSIQLSMRRRPSTRSSAAAPPAAPPAPPAAPPAPPAAPPAPPAHITFNAGDFIRDKDKLEAKRAKLHDHPSEKDMWIFAWCEQKGRTWVKLHNGNSLFGVGFQSYRKAWLFCFCYNCLVHAMITHRH